MEKLTKHENMPAWYDDKKKLDIVKKTVSSKPLTDEQFLYFLELCKLYDLNPFLKQVTVIPQKNKVSAFVTIDGLWAIAQRTGRVNGLESGTRKEGNDYVGYCKLYVKDMSYPIITEVYLSEFINPGKHGRVSAWDKMPKYMVKKVAEAHALKRAFPENLSGLYSEEEKWTEKEDFANNQQKVSENKVDELNTLKKELQITEKTLSHLREKKVPVEKVVELLHYLKRNSELEVESETWFVEIDGWLEANGGLS